MKEARLSSLPLGAAPASLPTRRDPDEAVAVVDIVPELVRRARAGDSGAFESLYRIHRPAVVRVLRFRLGGDVEDAVSEVFFRAWRALPRYSESGAPFAAWLYGIARNIAADERRRLRRTTPTAKIPDRPVREAEPAEIVDLRRAIGRLPEDQRRIVELKYLIGLSNRELARAMGTTTNAVNAKRWRALRALAAHLEEAP